MTTITFAGYGVWDKTNDVTSKVTQQYANKQRKFVANNDDYGDPEPHERKYLYLVWNNNGTASGENDDLGIILP